MMLADPHFLAVEVAALDKPWVAAARRACRSTAGPSARPTNAARAAPSRRRRRSGKPMADREPELTARIARGVRRCRCRACGTVLPGADPLIEPRASCRCSKTSAASGRAPAGPRSPSWSSAAASIVGAAPAYLKTHSQGEYVFDHGWAEAWERAGGDLLPQAAGHRPLHAMPGPAACWATRQALLAAHREP